MQRNDQVTRRYLFQLLSGGFPVCGARDTVNDKRKGRVIIEGCSDYGPYLSCNWILNRAQIHEIEMYIATKYGPPDTACRPQQLFRQKGKPNATR